MLFDIAGVNAACAGGPTIQVLIDIRDAVLPNLVLPIGCWQLVFQYSRIAVEGRSLTSFFLQSHLTEQVIDSFVKLRL